MDKQLTRGEEKFLNDIMRKAAARNKKQIPQNPNRTDDQGPLENPLY